MLGEAKKSSRSAVRHRLHVEEPLARGAAVALTGDQAHRILNVLRAAPGDEFGLFNGRDGEWHATLGKAGKREAILDVGEQLRPQAPDSDLWLLFAPVKRGPLDLIAEKATELGVSALLPIWTARTDPQRVNLERLRSIAIEASEQCGRLTVPEIREPSPLDDAISSWPRERRLIVLDESGEGAPIARILPSASDAPAAFLVGPEGGFTESELDGLRSLAFAVAADLGPRILRAETAAIAALACYQALRGVAEEPASAPSR